MLDIVSTQVTENTDVELSLEPVRLRLSVFGLGYVGAVSTACFAQEGISVIGVDPDIRKVTSIGSGKSPIVEPQLNEFLEQGVQRGKIATATDAYDAVLETDVSFVCVGTPSAPDGSCDLKYLKDVSRQIGLALKDKPAYHVIVFRSTVPPGTTRDILCPIIEEASGKARGVDFGIGFHPEFLRESTAITDFYDPPKTVIGGINDRTNDVIKCLYEGIDEDIITTSIESAEMVKYVDNTWHALKVSFANEIGKICRATHVDSHQAMDIFVQDTKLNLSPYYLKPGFAFGGSCLPKDVRGMNHMATDLGVDTPVLQSIISSNDAQIEHALQLIRSTDPVSVGFLGLTFKPDTDDLRESPVIPVIARLLEEGFEIHIYDPHLDIENSVAHHLQHSKTEETGAVDVMTRLPNLVRESAEIVQEKCDTLVVSHRNPDFRDIAFKRSHHQHVVDFVRLFDSSGAWQGMQHAGMNDYVQKPVRRESLLKALDCWTSGFSGRGRHVLVVEDDLAMSVIVKSMLEQLGCIVTIVENGMEAVEAVSREKFDLTFMDVSMPVMDGLEATKTIRQMSGSTSRMPIIGMTSYAVPEQSSTYSGICW